MVTYSEGYVLNGRQQYVGPQGKPLAGGTVTFYQPGTTTLVTTYQDDAQSVVNTNPIVLDAGGYATVYYHLRVRQIVKDILGNLIWDVTTTEDTNPVTLTNISALRANSTTPPEVFIPGYYSDGDGGGGLFHLVTSDTTSADDGGSIIVDAAGNRWYRYMSPDTNRVNILWWGAQAGSGSSPDCYASLAACFTYAAAQGMVPYFPAGLFYTTQALTLTGNAAGIYMEGTLVSEGDFIGLTLGDNGSTKNINKHYGPLRVMRRVTSDWSNTTSDIGVRIYNCNGCVVTVESCQGFAIGLQTYGDATGFQNSKIYLGVMVDNGIHVDVHTGQASGWNNEVDYFGGFFNNNSGTNTSAVRYGIRFSAEPGAYVLHNAHNFFGPSFQLQDQTGTGGGKARPFYFQATSGRAVRAFGVRMEASSSYVALVDYSWSDSTIEVEYVGTYAFNIDVEYATTATRSSISIEVRHQAAAAYASLRNLVNLENIREYVFSNYTVSTNGWGVEKMAVLSSNPSGPPTTLSGFCFPGLSGMGLNSDSIQLPTSRALAFVVDCSTCKEFFFAFEGNSLRPVIMQFDSSGNLLGNTYPLTLSNADVTWDPLGNAYWWEMTTNLDQLTGGYPLAKLERVRFHPSAAYGVVGVRGGDSVTPANNILRAARLYCSPLYYPQIIYGNQYTWGTREYKASVSISVAALTGGSTYQYNATVSGARQGDFVQAAFDQDSGFQNGGILVHAVIGGGSTNTIAVTFQNVSAGTITLGSGTLYTRGVRPKL